MLGSPDYPKQLSNYVDDPNAVMKAQARKMRPLAEKLKPIVESDGWQEVIQPFLDRHGDPQRLFKVGISEREIGKVEAYHNLNRLIKNILESLKIKEEEEGEV